MKKFAEILKERREMAGLTQGQVASYINKTERTYQRYEAGALPTRGIINKLSELLKYDFLEGQEGTPIMQGGQSAAYIIRLDAKLTVLLGAVAEVIASQKSLTATQVRSSLESAVSEQERVLLSQHGL